MRIEKINDNQIKFFLNKDDLVERNIDLLELAQGTEKAQALFRDIMEEAMEVCGFNAENVLLMVEAMSVSSDSIIIVVSKVTNEENVSKAIKLEPESRNERKYHIHALMEDEEEETSENSDILIYSFKCLDDVSKACALLREDFIGESMLCKQDNKYFLILSTSESDTFTDDKLNSVLSEYGSKQTSTLISKYHILEFGEVIVKASAVGIMSEL